MFWMDGKYGDIHINGISENIEKISVDKLYEYLKIYENRLNKLVEQQNDYLSKLIG